MYSEFDYVVARSFMAGLAVGFFVGFVLWS